MAGGLPSEILNFIRKPGGRSLLVKGASGAGKTLFAVQLAFEVRSAFRPHYISPHVSDASLQRQFPSMASRLVRPDAPLLRIGTPWIAPCPSCGASFEIKPSKRPIEVVCPNCNAVQRFADRTELHRLIGYIQHSGEHEEKANTIPLDLPEIETAYEVVDADLRAPSRPRTLVVVDPIDALEDLYGIPAWRLVKPLQRDLVENTRVSVVIIVSPDASKLDPIVDGSVRLSAHSSGNAGLRTLTIEKLRGHEIRRRRIALFLRRGRLTEATIELASRLDPHDAASRENL